MHHDHALRHPAPTVHSHSAGSMGQLNLEPPLAIGERSLKDLEAEAATSGSASGAGPSSGPGPSSPAGAPNRGLQRRKSHTGGQSFGLPPIRQPSMNSKGPNSSGPTSPLGLTLGAHAHASTVFPPDVESASFLHGQMDTSPPGPPPVQKMPSYRAHLARMNSSRAGGVGSTSGSGVRRAVSFGGQELQQLVAAAGRRMSNTHATAGASSTSGSRRGSHAGEPGGELMLGARASGSNLQPHPPDQMGDRQKGRRDSELGSGLDAYGLEAAAAAAVAAVDADRAEAAAAAAASSTARQRPPPLRGPSFSGQPPSGPSSGGSPKAPLRPSSRLGPPSRRISFATFDKDHNADADGSPHASHHLHPSHHSSSNLATVSAGGQGQHMGGPESGPLHHAASTPQESASPGGLSEDVADSSSQCDSGPSGSVHGEHAGAGGPSDPQDAQQQQHAEVQLPEGRFSRLRRLSSWKVQGLDPLDLLRRKSVDGEQLLAAAQAAKAAKARHARRQSEAGERAAREQQLKEQREREAEEQATRQEREADEIAAKLVGYF